MRKRTVIWLIVATVLVVLGGVLFTLSLAQSRWRIDSIGTETYQTLTHYIKDDFQSISVTTNTADVLLLPSTDAQCRVVCYEDARQPHVVSAENGTLSIRLVDNRRWHDHIRFFSWETAKITVYLPLDQYENLKIQNSTGDVTVPGDFTFQAADIALSTGAVTFDADTENAATIKTTTGDITLSELSAGRLQLTVSSGKITASNVTCADTVSVRVNTGNATLRSVTCQHLVSDGDTGDITLTEVVASQKLAIERDTGNVRFEQCDAAEIFVETDTGDVTGSLCSEKVFLVETDTGRVDVPKSVNGGRCEIVTDTGDVKITVK